MSGTSFANPRRWPRWGRTRMGHTIGVGSAALAALGIALCLADPAARLIYNATASAPLGFYWLDRDAAPQRGEFVLAWAPSAARALAARRGYLPFDVPLVKRVAAVRGERICADGRTIFVDGHAVATRLAKDREGRALPHWQGCRVLGSGDVFLLMAAVPDSFDGRYFGAIARQAVIGRLIPLWTW